jgi:hypothetical protein
MSLVEARDAAAKIADDVRIALPLICDIMLLKQKSKIKFLDQWQTDVRMQPHYERGEARARRPAYSFSCPIIGPWCVISGR